MPAAVGLVGGIDDTLQIRRHAVPVHPARHRPLLTAERCGHQRPPDLGGHYPLHRLPKIVQPSGHAFLRGDARQRGLRHPDAAGLPSLFQRSVHRPPPRGAGATRLTGDIIQAAHLLRFGLCRSGHRLLCPTRLRCSMPLLLDDRYLHLEIMRRRVQYRPSRGRLPHHLDHWRVEPVECRRESAPLAIVLPLISILRLQKQFAHDQRRPGTRRRHIPQPLLLGGLELLLDRLHLRPPRRLCYDRDVVSVLD